MELLEKVLDDKNLIKACDQVYKNKGASGIDGITVDMLYPYFYEHKEEIKQLGERVDKQNAVMETISGLATAYQVKDPAKLKEMVMKETALGHFDFVRGINEYLAKNASKEIYKK